MIGDMLRSWGAKQRREFEHDRSDTTGASAIGRCARATVFEKLATPPDPGFVPSWGAALRGTLIEDHYFYPALKAIYGDRLLFAGPDQKTFVQGFLSGTPDGLLVSLDRHVLAGLGIDDIGPSRSIVIECKSTDPRANLRAARPEHVFQVQVGIGLIRACTPSKPEYGVISYIDASFLDKVTEFPVRFDERIYEAARVRARQIMSCEDPLEVSPEGQMAGGKECEYCPWTRACGQTNLQRIPEGGVRLPADAVAELKGLRDIERGLAASLEETKQSQEQTKEAMKQLLRSHDARAHRDKDWSVQWSETKARVTVDVAALEKAGFDLEPYKREGKPSERLTIT